MLKSYRNIFSQNQLGFTLVELLVVIAVLGVLAASVLIAINPLEQLNRAKDAGLRSTAEQVRRAADSYTAVQGNIPNNSWTADGTNNYGQKVLLDVGDLKQPIITNPQMYFWADGVKYQINLYPSSKSSIQEAFNGIAKGISDNCAGKTSPSQIVSVTYYYYSPYGAWHWWCN